MPLFLKQSILTSTLVAVFCMTSASGVAAQALSDPSAATEKADVDASVESARVAARAAAVWLASGVDSWFGNKPFSEGGQVNDGEVNVKFYSRQDQKPTMPSRSTPGSVCPIWSRTLICSQGVAQRLTS